MKLEAELNTIEKKVTLSRMKDPWADFSLWLEVTGEAAYHAMKYTEKSENEILDFADEYLQSVIRYKREHK